MGTKQNEQAEVAGRVRAPRGGMTVAGVYYAGGQFLPSGNVPKRGQYNRRPARKGKSKVRKVEVAPRVWVENPEGKRSLFSVMNGTFARFDEDGCAYMSESSNVAQVLKYLGYTMEEAQDVVDCYNAGKLWFED